MLLGPSSIKTFEAKNVKIERFRPTSEDINLSHVVVQDQISPEVEQKIEKLVGDAEQRLEEARSPEDYLVLATEKWRAKDYDEALRLVHAGLSLNPEDIRTHATLIHRKASIYVALGSENLGIKYYEEAIKLDSQFPMPHFNLGTLYSGQGEMAEAEAEYKEAIRLDPKDAGPHNNLGILYKDQEKMAEAEAEFKEALRLDSKHTLVQENLDRLYREMKKS